MAIQLPEIKRNMEAPAPSSAGRIDAKMPDKSGETEAVAQGLVKLGNTAYNIADKYELNAVDDEKLKAKIAYSDWYRRKIEGDSKTGQLGLQHIQGDPTQAYNDFDKQATEKFDEILANPNLSSRARSGVQTGLLEAYNSLHSNRLVTYGGQHAKYQANLTDAAVNLDVEGAVESVQFVDVNDPKSTALFEQKIDGIRKTFTNYALKTDAAVDAPDGEVKHIDGDGNLRHLKMDPAIKNSMKKSYSKAVGTSVEVLIDSKKLPEAKMFMDKYKGYIDGATMGKLTKEYEKKEVEIGADMHLAKIGDMPEGAQRTYLNKLPKNTPQQVEIFKKLRDEIDDNQMKKDRALDRQSNNIGDMLAKSYYEATESGNPYHSLNDFMKGTTNGVLNSKLMNGIEDDEKRKKLHALFTDVKDSDPKVWSKMMEAIANKDLNNWSHEQLTLEMGGLSKPDKAKVSSAWLRANDDTDTEQRGRYEQGVNLMKLAANDYFRKSGKITNKSRRQYDDAVAAVAFDPPPKGANVQEHVKSVLARVIKGKGEKVPVDTPSPTTEPSTTKKASKIDYRTIPKIEQERLKQEFKKANGGQDLGLEKFKQWYESQ